MKYISQIMAAIGLACVPFSKLLGLSFHNDVLTLFVLCVGIGLFLSSIPIALKALKKYKDVDTCFYELSMTQSALAVLLLTFGAHIAVYIIGFVATVAALCFNIAAMREILSSTKNLEGECYDV